MSALRQLEPPLTLQEVFDRRSAKLRLAPGTQRPGVETETPSRRTSPGGEFSLSKVGRPEVALLASSGVPLETFLARSPTLAAATVGRDGTISASNRPAAFTEGVFQSTSMTHPPLTTPVTVPTIVVFSSNAFFSAAQSVGRSIFPSVSS